MSPRTPLQTTDDHWRSRWLVFGNTGGLLHRVSDDIVWAGDDADDLRHGTGTTLCGRAGHLSMPGMFSRMGLTRCARCCRLVGIPDGDGAPFNQGIAEVEP